MQSLSTSKRLVGILGAIVGDKALEHLSLVIDSALQIVGLAVDLSNTSSRCQRHLLDFIAPTRRLRISAANIGPNLCHQKLTVSWLISIPRSRGRSSTLRSETGNRTYFITVRRMISG